MNRGLSRRPLFELRADKRRFLALLACAVRAGRIRVHCFCLMDTHFHLIVESVDGNISATMGWIQSRHSLHFNRTRGRDGPLVRGRFKSIPIDSRIYLFLLIRYIDRNPLDAGLSQDPLDYEFGSAALHARPAGPPPWVAHSLVGEFVSASCRLEPNAHATYRETFHGWADGAGNEGLVTARLDHRSREKDDLDALLRANGGGRRAWLVRRAAEADGTAPGLPMVAAGVVGPVVACHRRRAPGASLQGPGGRALVLWDVAEVGLLRDLCGLGHASIGRLLEISAGTVSKRYRFHRGGLREDAAYLTIVGELARQMLEAGFGKRVLAIAETLAHSHLSRGDAKDA